MTKPRTKNYELNDEYIELCALLKTVVPMSSGGEAKHVIREGLVQVDGIIETRKKCKIRTGQTVIYEGLEIQVL